jgi:hypothetical protein
MVRQNEVNFCKRYAGLSRVTQGKRCIHLDHPLKKVPMTSEHFDKINIC